MHPIANVGISTTIAEAVTVLVVYALSLVHIIVPDTVTEALTTLLAIASGYLIHTNTQPAVAPLPAVLKKGAPV